MCETCGCNDPDNKPSIGNTILFRASHEIKKPNLAGITPAREIQVREDVLGNNDVIAAKTRNFLIEKKILALNLVGSPGSGKTTLIEKTIRALSGETPVSVIEGDQFGSLDADRISATGSDVIQINTGNGCHLDASGVSEAINKLDLRPNSLLIIENVGNLVCPALFDLGEHLRVVILSVTEGDDKPVKYAPIFHGSSVCLINKTDLSGYVDFDIDKAKSNLKKINHQIQVIELSATKGEGFGSWLELIREETKKLQS